MSLRGPTRVNRLCLVVHAGVLVMARRIALTWCIKAQNTVRFRSSTRGLRARTQGDQMGGVSFRRVCVCIAILLGPLVQIDAVAQPATWRVTVKGGAKVDHPGRWAEFGESGCAGDASGRWGSSVLAGFLAVRKTIVLAVQFQDADVMGQSVEPRVKSLQSTPAGASGDVLADRPHRRHSLQNDFSSRSRIDERRADQRTPDRRCVCVRYRHTR